MHTVVKKTGEKKGEIGERRLVHQKDGVDIDGYRLVQSQKTGEGEGGR